MVDNGSDSQNVDLLKENYGNHPKVNLILNDENLGFTKGNNAIMREIINRNDLPEYIILLNNDTVVDPEWLQNLVASAKRNNADIVSSKMIDYYERNKMDNSGHMMLNTGEVIPVAHGLPVDEYVEGKENLGACAGAALYSSKMLKRIGLFDERFNTGYEDAEIGIRAVVLGYKCFFEPTAIVYHKMGRSVKKVFNYDYSLSIQKHIWYSYLKLMPISVILITLPSFVFKYFSMLIIDLVFWKPQYLKIMYQSLKETFIDDFSEIRIAREKFMSNYKPISSSKILRKQTFFLLFDIKRFYKFYILRKTSALDSYGKVESVETS